MAADEGCFVGLIAESEQFVGAVACLTCWICACRGSTLRFGLEADGSLVDRCSYYEHAWIVGGCLLLVEDTASGASTWSKSARRDSASSSWISA